MDPDQLRDLFGQIRDGAMGEEAQKAFSEIAYQTQEAPPIQRQFKVELNTQVESQKTQELYQHLLLVQQKCDENKESLVQLQL